MYESKPKLSTNSKIAVFFLMIMVFAGFFAVVSWILQSQNQSSSGNQNQSSQKFVGSINSNVYHYPGCHYVDRIKAGNRIWFSGSADARAHGYRPCKVCNPP